MAIYHHLMNGRLWNSTWRPSVTFNRSRGRQTSHMDDISVSGFICHYFLRIKIAVKCFKISEPQCVNGIVVVIIITEYHHHHDYHWAATATRAVASFSHYIRMSFLASPLASADFKQHWYCALENVHMTNRADILMYHRCQSRHVIPMVMPWWLI